LTHTLQPGRTSLPPRLRLVAEHEDCRVAHVKNVVIIHWRRAPRSLDARPAVEAGYKAAMDAAPDGRFGLLVILDPSMPVELPSGIVRAEMAKLRRAWGAHIIAEAIVLERDSWRATFVRTVLRQLDALAKSPYEHEVFSAAIPAMAWLCRKLPATSHVSARELHEAALGLGMLVGR
jgi:hypothetical protein